MAVNPLFFLSVTSTVGLTGIDARGQEGADSLGVERETDPLELVSR